MTKRLIVIVALSLALSLFAVATFAEMAKRDGFIGIITKSDDQNKIGAQITFANLRTSLPFITFPSGNGAESSKVFEDDEIVVLLFVAGASGSTETYYINKKKLRFTRIEVGALEATVSGKDFIPKVSHGILK